MDVSSFLNVTSSPVKQTLDTNMLGASTKTSDSENMFRTFFDSAVDSIKTTNGYISDTENEEIKWALGETENTHDLTIALQKSSTAMQYTIAVRDKFMEAYREIMQIQM